MTPGQSAVSHADAGEADAVTAFAENLDDANKTEHPWPMCGLTFWSEIGAAATSSVEGVCQAAVSASDLMYMLPYRSPLCAELLHDGRQPAHF